MINHNQLAPVLTLMGLLGVTTTIEAASTAPIWNGVYVGADLGVAKPFVTNRWLAETTVVGGVDQSAARNRIDRADSIMGFHAGYMQQLKPVWGQDWVGGIEFKYMPKKIRNTTLYNDNKELTNSEHAIFELNSMSSIRGRLGIDVDNTLLVASAGVAMVDSRFGASTDDIEAASANGGQFREFNRTHPFVGIGLERKLTNNFVFKVEADHYFIYDKISTSTLGDGRRDGTQTSYVRFNNLTTATAGLSYYFS